MLLMLYMYYFTWTMLHLLHNLGHQDHRALCSWPKCTALMPTPPGMALGMGMVTPAATPWMMTNCGQTAPGLHEMPLALICWTALWKGIIIYFWNLFSCIKTLTMFECLEVCQLINHYGCNFSPCHRKMSCKHKIENKKGLCWCQVFSSFIRSSIWYQY